MLICVTLQYSFLVGVCFYCMHVPPTATSECLRTLCTCTCSSNYVHVQWVHVCHVVHGLLSKPHAHDFHMTLVQFRSQLTWHTSASDSHPAQIRHASVWGAHSRAWKCTSEYYCMRVLPAVRSMRTSCSHLTPRTARGRPDHRIRHVWNSK